MKREDLAWLLSVANDMRRKKGSNEIEDLPDSEAGVPSRCIIANAFNFGCNVYPGHKVETSEIIFKTKEDLDTYLKIMDLDQDSVVTENDEYKYYAARLTEDLNQVAIAFDEGEYKEYEEVYET
jgi:hypothetical protein